MAAYYEINNSDDEDRLGDLIYKSSFTGESERNVPNTKQASAWAELFGLHSLDAKRVPNRIAGNSDGQLQPSPAPPHTHQKIQHGAKKESCNSTKSANRELNSKPKASVQENVSEQNGAAMRGAMNRESKARSRVYLSEAVQITDRDKIRECMRIFREKTRKREETLGVSEEGKSNQKPSAGDGLSEQEREDLRRARNDERRAERQARKNLSEQERGDLRRAKDREKKARSRARQSKVQRDEYRRKNRENMRRIRRNMIKGTHCVKNQTMGTHEAAHVVSGSGF